MRCAGCISKLEAGLAAAPGIVSARVNFTAKRVAVTHLPDIAIPELTAAFADLGFEAQPLTQALVGGDDESRKLLRAMAVAGFAAMNVMLLSVSVWSGATGRDARPVPLAVGADRAAGHRLCRAAVLPFGLDGAQPPPHQHGRADLDRRHPGDRAQPLRDDDRRRPRLFRQRHHAAVLPADGPLARCSDA